MMAQPRLPGTLPSPEQARKNHKAAVKAEREAERTFEIHKEASRALRAALKDAQKQRQSAEDDLDAIEEGRRAG